MFRQPRDPPADYGEAPGSVQALEISTISQGVGPSLIRRDVPVILKPLLNLPRVPKVGDSEQFPSGDGCRDHVPAVPNLWFPRSLDPTTVRVAWAEAPTVKRAILAGSARGTRGIRVGSGRACLSRYGTAATRRCARGTRETRPRSCLGFPHWSLALPQRSALHSDESAPIGLFC